MEKDMGDWVHNLFLFWCGICDYYLVYFFHHTSTLCTRF